MEKILLSIIIPTFNSTKYVDETILSIKNEPEFENVEIIVIDDGSKDNTKEKILKYKNSLKYLRFFEKTHTGVSDSRNIGINNASGEYIMFVDSDDLLVEGWFSIVKKTIINSDKSDLIYISDGIPREISDKKIIENEQRIGLIFSMLGMKNSNFKINTFHPGPFSKLFRTNFLKENGILFDTRIQVGEDMLFNLNVLTNNQSTIYLYKSKFYLYRLNSESVTHHGSKKLSSENILFFKLLEHNLEEYAPISFEKKEIILFRWMIFYYRNIFASFGEFTTNNEFKNKIKKILKNKKNILLLKNKLPLKQFILFLMIIYLPNEIGIIIVNKLKDRKNRKFMDF